MASMKKQLRSMVKYALLRNKEMKWFLSEMRHSTCGAISGGVVRSPFQDIQIPDKTFTDLIWERHAQWRHCTAVECGVTGEGYSYEGLLERAEDLGSGLLGEAAGRGEVLAFLLPNCPEYVVSLLGASRAGLTICSINPLYTPDEIGYQLKNSGAKSIVTYPEKVPDVMKAVRKLVAEGIVIGNFQIFSTRGLDGRKSPLPCGVRSLEDLLWNGRSRGSGKRADSLAFISHSSGTTGLPKGVCLSHRNVTASILQMAQKETSIFRQTTSAHQDVIPMVLPIFHNFGLEIVLDALYHGSKIVTLPKFDENTFLRSLIQHKATMLFAVPPIILLLGLKEDATKEHLEHLRVIFTAAAPIGEEDLLRCLKKAPPHVSCTQGYGQTEGMCCITFTPYGVKNFNTVGIPVVNTEVKIVDVESGETQCEFKHGELCFRGPQMSLSYLNDPQATAEAKDSDGWFHSGDVGFYDSEGYFYIVDRIKELIKVKGFQVAPAELEAVLRSHPCVEDAAVTGMPDERKGEVPVGFIKVKPQMKLSEQDLRQFLSEKVATFKVINKYIFIDSIPKSPSGKILRKNLKVLLKNMN